MHTMNNSVIVIGAGITGLVAAYTLRKTYPGKIVVLEGQPTIGGKIRTERSNGCLLELGPDTIHDRGGLAYSLLSELGLSQDIVVPLQSGYSVLHKGSLHAVDSGIMGSLTGKAKAIWNTKAVSLTGKLRAVLGNLGSPSVNGVDISIADYGRARWGKEFSQIIVEPLLAGIHGGDSARLSMKALYPYLLSSNSQGKSPKPISKSPAIFALKNGLSSMVEELKAHLPAESLKVGVRARSVGLTEAGDEVVVKLNDRTELKGDACIVTTPANVAAQLVEKSLPEEASILSSIPFASTVVVTVAFPLNTKRHIPYGNGIIGTASSRSPISACTWSSLKWRGRAPEEILLARCFLHPDTKEEYLSYSDEKLSAVVAQELQKILRTSIRPLFVQVKRWENAFPQYELGHIEKVKRLKALEKNHSELRFAGASFRGASITSCINDAMRVAEQIEATLAEVSTEKINITDRRGAYSPKPKHYKTEDLQNA